VPLDRPIFNRSLALTALVEMHDRQIVATALHMSRPGTAVALITRDSKITASGLVPVVW
jgi:hypothetical protein